MLSLASRLAGWLAWLAGYGRMPDGMPPLHQLSTPSPPLFLPFSFFLPSLAAALRVASVARDAFATVGGPSGAKLLPRPCWCPPSRKYNERVAGQQRSQTATRLTRTAAGPFACRGGSRRRGGGGGGDGGGAGGVAAGSRPQGWSPPAPSTAPPKPKPKPPPQAAAAGKHSSSSSSSGGGEEEEGFQLAPGACGTATGRLSTRSPPRRATTQHEMANLIMLLEMSLHNDGGGRQP